MVCYRLLRMLRFRLLQRLTKICDEVLCAALAKIDIFNRVHRQSFGLLNCLEKRITIVEKPATDQRVVSVILLISVYFLFRCTIKILLWVVRLALLADFDIISFLSNLVCFVFSRLLTHGLSMLCLFYGQN